MIRLELEEHCHSCTEFTAYTNKVEYYGAGEIVETELYITCANASLCRRIQEQIKRCNCGQE